MNGRVSIVLLIEQDAIQRGTLARILKTAGYSVIPAGRAHEALETFSTHHVDIALVVANTAATASAGPPLLESLATIDPHVPVVVLSAGVAIERPAYEYPNVAALLVRPFEAADVLQSVERVLMPASQHAAAPVTIAKGRGAAFSWPPTEEELADIQVVDTKDWRVPAESRALARVVTPPPAKPALPVISAMPAPSDLVEIEPVELPSQARLAPPRLVVHGLERRQWSYGDNVSPQTRRSLTVAATALCGLALTTLLELRSTPASQAALMDEPVREVASAPVLAASHHPVDVMPLAPARRVRSRPLADVISREPALRARLADSTARGSRPATIDTMKPAPQSEANRAIAARRVETRDVPRRNVSSRPSSETRAAASVVPPTPPAPSPAGAAPAEAIAATTMTAALDDTTSTKAAPAANVPVPAVASASTPSGTPTATFAVTRSGADERNIYQVLERYERAYERLDVNAARAVWPSLDTRALARAFDGLKTQALEFSHCRVALDLAEATAICGGHASYVPRVGRQAARTEPREWTFRLRRIDHDWVIAKAEVR